MRYFVTVVVGLLVTLAATAQHQITGAVFNEKGQPLPFASVFLSQTTMGSRTAENGQFSIKDVPPGRYDLIVSYLGYEPKQLAITVNANLPGMRVVLTQKPGMLKEFVVKRDADREWWLKVFKQLFIGESSLAGQCRLLNSEIIDLQYDPSKQVLSASADDFLIIENRALGYRLKFLLIGFEYNMRSRYSYYYGNSLYEPMTGSSRQQRRWEKNREEAYLGSTMHFYRSLISRKLADDGFSVQKLIRKQVKPGTGHIFLRGPGQQQPFSDAMNLLVRGQVPYDSIYVANGNGYSLIFKDHLYVIYGREREDRLYVEKYKPKQTHRPKQQVSLMRLLAQEVPMDVNGNVWAPVDVVLEQYWGWEKVAEMLPLDYKP